GDLPGFRGPPPLEPLLAGERSVMRSRDLLLRKLVEPQGETLGEPAVVDEDDRRAMLLDELEDLGVDRGPDRLAWRLPAGAQDVGDLRVHARLAHVLERHDDLEIKLLRPAGVDELDRAAAGDELPDLLEWALRRREADPLERLPREALEALDRHRQVSAALSSRHCVDL